MSSPLSAADLPAGPGAGLGRLPKMVFCLLFVHVFIFVGGIKQKKMHFVL
jgi:hypothetical protein